MANSHWNTTNIPDLTEKVIIITGSSSGIGKEAVRILTDKNATVVMAVRNTQKGLEVAQQIQSKNRRTNIDVRALDLTSLDSIKTFADGFFKDYSRLDVLFNNAGIMMCPFSKTKDGFEIQMGTNHLGHFALTGLLMPILKQTKGSRIVATSSAAHKQGKIDFADINWEKREYKTIRAYGDSKLANLYFVYELVRKLNGDADAPTVTVAHPGWANTDLQRHSGMMSFLNRFFAQTPDKGILPSLRAAFDSNAKSGDFFGPSGLFEVQGSPVLVKSNKKSHEKDTAKKLWEVSEKLTGIKY